MALTKKTRGKYRDKVWYETGGDLATLPASRLYTEGVDI